MKHTIILIILSFLASQSFGQNQCLKRRAVFDIGSGSTKLNVFEFDICKSKITKQIKKHNNTNCKLSRKVSYRKDFEQNGKLTNKIIKLGKKALKDLRRRALKCGATQFAAVATSAFRVASNGNEALLRLGQTLKVNIHKIDHKEEAILGYKSVIKASDTSKEKICSWDIGGSSMQIVCFHKGEFLIYPGKLASVSFLSHILKIQKSETDSPNPINRSIARSASKYARKYALESVPLKIRTLLKKGVRVMGIGGVHSYSIASNYSIKSYRSDTLIPLYKSRLNLSDRQLIEQKLIKKSQIPYAESTVSNLLLVQSFMEALKIKKVEVTSASISEGVVLTDKYWPKSRF